MIKIDKQPNQRICQGDIYKDIYYIEYAVEKMGIVEISKILFPIVIVLSQDCDLQQDHKFRHAQPRKPTQDKYLFSVLVAPLYNVEHFYNGEQLSKLGLTMAIFERRHEKTANKSLKNNEIPRYHYLEFPEGVVPSVIDFKHYFSVDVRYLLESKDNSFDIQSI